MFYGVRSSPNCLFLVSYELCGAQCFWFCRKHRVEVEMVLIVRRLIVPQGRYPITKMAKRPSAQEANTRIRFGNKLRELRLAKGWSQMQLSFECKLDRTYVGGVERGERNISLINIKKLADALGVKPSVFFD